MSEDGIRIPIGWQDIKSKEMFACDPPPLLYHYTSYQGGNDILRSKSLWLTKIQYLNDTTELHFAIDLFREIAKARVASLEDEQKRALLAGASEQLESFRETNICVGSFCEDGDLLSQWRAYGNRAHGVALGFQGKALRSLTNTGRLNIWRCVYDKEAQRAIASDLVDILLGSYDVLAGTKNYPDGETAARDLISYFNTTFLRVAPVLKDHHFREEREWRIITNPISSIDKDYHSRISNNRVAQYFSVDLKLLDSGKFEFIEHIVIGPAQDPELVADAFWLLASKEGYKPKRMSASQVPYRTLS